MIQCCITELKNPEFPVKHLQIPLATVAVLQLETNWIENATVPLKIIVPGKNADNTEYLDVFSYPDVCETRGQVEFRTFDFTHILTNLRTQILTRGLDYCHKEHFQELSRNKPENTQFGTSFRQN